MPIVPLPQFELDLEEDRKIYAALKPPTSVVVRFGLMKMIGEFPYAGDAKPGCGTKFVVRTHRGTELAEMLTSTCPNAGCSKSISRKDMLEYFENSGGKDYPFFTQGRVLRIATPEDLAQQAALDQQRPDLVRRARAVTERLRVPIKISDAEPILGGERLTFHFYSEDRIDFRELVHELALELQTRIEMHQVGARDEARLIADYERCGQHCCCKQFLKVLKPVSMKAAKIQKATLDPLKISGRCGRLMCCLRYEEQTYDDLRARLPKKKSVVETHSGWGVVIDGQILTQLVLVRLDATNEDIAVPVEDLKQILPPGTPPPALATPPTPPPSAQPGPRPQGRDRGPRDGPRDQRPRPQPADGQPTQSGDGAPPPRQQQSQRSPQSQRPPNQGGPGPQSQSSQSQGQQNQGPNTQGPPPSQRPPAPRPPAARPPSQGSEDSLDDLMAHLDGPGPRPSNDTPPDGPFDPNSPDAQRRRRRRKRRPGPDNTTPPNGPATPPGPPGPSGPQDSPTT